jgi:hypothetical protein
MENELKKIYMKGFNDELDSIKPPDWFKNDIQKRTYFVGRYIGLTANDINPDGIWEEALKEIIKSL